MFDIARDRRETLNKEKEERKMRNETTAINIFLVSLLYIEKIIFC